MFRRNLLSTKIAVIDFKKIMGNATKRSRWRDKWVIYDAYGINVELKVGTIDVQENKMALKVRVSVMIDGHKDTNQDTITLSMNDEHYNPTVLVNSLSNTIKRLIELAYRYLATDVESEVYYNAQNEDNLLDQEHRQGLIDWLDENEVVLAELRTAYLSQNRKYFYDNVHDFQDNFRTEERDRLSELVISSLKFAL